LKQTAHLCLLILRLYHTIKPMASGCAHLIYVNTYLVQKCTKPFK